MRIAIALALVTGCYADGARFDFEARAVVGVEPQRVSAAAVPGAADARWLSIRTGDADVLYQLEVDGTALVVTSAFTGQPMPVSYDPSFPDAAARPRPGSLALPLRGPVPGPDPSEVPGEIPFQGSFELSILGGDAPVRVPVQIAPSFDPCVAAWPPGGTGEAAVPIAARAASGGAPLAQDATSVIVPPFTVRVFVQTSCVASAG